MSEDTKGQTEAPPKKPRASLRSVFDRNTTSLGGGEARKLPRRMLTFTVDADCCAPGIFDEDFELTLGSLTPTMELEAAREAKGDPATMAMIMARKSLVQFNGEAIEAGQDEWLWVALDSGGRQLVMAMFVNVGTPGEVALGKATASLRVS